MIDELVGAHRRLLGVVGAGALVAGVCVGTLIATGGSASASGTADISVSHRFGPGPASGQTIDAVTVHNSGTATANSIEAIYLLKSSSTSGWTVRSSSAGLCQIEPAPPGYTGMVSCPLGSLAGGHSVIDNLTWGGSAGAAFTVTASIGDASPADPSLANNTSTASSWFGPRADLRLSGTLAAGRTAGKGTAVTTVHNHGPNNAAALQEIVEIKGKGLRVIASAKSTSCQFVPAASGYDAAVACVTNSLAAGSSWVISFAYTGSTGEAVTTKTTVTANSPADPVTSNNTQTLSTHLHR